MQEELSFLKLPGFLKLKDPHILSLKMFPVCYRMTKAGRFALLDLQQNIRKNMQKRFDLCYNGLEQYNFVLEQGLARRNWQKSQGQLQQVQDAIRQQMQKRLHSAELQLGHAAALTGSLDPYQVLARGYTMVTAANGTILNADDLQPEKTIYVRSASRRAKCRVEAVEEINENTQKF